MSEIEGLVEEAAARSTALTLSVDELCPERVLEILAEAESSYRVEIRSAAGCITVEVGNGLVVGAEAELGGRVLCGKEAYASIRGVADGEVHVAPLRFPSLANILEPVAQLPELTALGPALAGADTIEVALPEARPFHPPAISELPTMELVLEPSDPTAVDIDPRVRRPAAILGVTEITEVAVPEASRAPSRRRRAAIIIGAVAALALGSVGAAWSATRGEPTTPTERVAPLAASSSPVSAHLATTTEVDMDLSDVRQTGAPDEARRLARAARTRLRAGDAPGALDAAQRAAQLRGGRPFYQVLLGDALRANGRRAAARRAYRRAVRLRPGYRPAVRRLQRRAGRNRSDRSSTT